MAKKKEKRQAQEAMRPEFFANLESIRRNEQAKRTGVSEEEQALYSMSLSDGWTHFENTANDLLSEIDNQIEASIAGGMSKEQIGENTIMATMVKQVIKALLNKVYDARDAAEKR